MSKIMDYLVKGGDDLAMCQAQLEHMGGYLGVEIKENEKLRSLLLEAALQIEYLHEKFAVTGTGNAVLTRIKSALDPVTRDMEASNG
jgi:hypothetical protein